MLGSKIKIVHGFILTIVILISTNTQAYFVRPVVTFGSQVTDGLMLNGATSKAVQFNDDARSTVDLSTGEMSLFAQGNGSSVSSSAQGTMGDTINFRNGMGTNVDISFGLDAILNATIIGDTPNSSFLGWSIAVAVFETGLVDHTNFFGNALQDDPGDIAPVFFRQISGNQNSPASDIVNFSINENIESSILLESNNVTLDFFYLASLFGASNGEVSSYTLDGENTATAGITVAPNVITTSDSGVFPVNMTTTNVPEPNIFGLLGLGLLSMLLFLRARKVI
ncbi:PEP-CTERM protein-sorting domain-containing protein [Nitrosomonas cryotolerans]|uniref:PEP-CTERM protein-sorting domain-containing protein n=1 Tax=Nitrosomonas cryotolerans ATCC 49181 TaxID=1131553 RepID=A0A1N6HZA2_9PROT|nr:PEP-CTERM sorting domain-containing protein [Nitrosomonas cryotolerans]SFP68498.1 PEP-CTERM protein-sorting domain-containing protein [Nitrosomonas cryotolerans]SIO24989.1 PEP-CTERM protein-sorting domain-containing protein [Nitrosomonas cryotolerans ATCC 49181]